MIMRPSSLRLVGSMFSLTSLFVWACTLEQPADPAADQGQSAPVETQATPIESSATDGEAFPGSAASLAQLGRNVIEALVAAEPMVLAGYRLTEEEHNQVVFPELPAGQPEVNYPVDMAWQNIELRDGRSVGRQIAWFDGRQVAFQQTRCEGETQAFQTFVVHTDCWVYFEDSEEGDLRIQLFKDVVERGGGFKVFRYYDESPRRPLIQ